MMIPTSEARYWAGRPRPAMPGGSRRARPSSLRGRRCRAPRICPRVPWHRRDPDAARAGGARRGSAPGNRASARPGCSPRGEGVVRGASRTASRRRATAPGPGLRRSRTSPCGPANSPTRSTTSSSTRRAICWRSGTTSPSAGGTRATTICSRRKRDCPASWESRRNSFRRRRGSPWGACSAPPAERRFSFPGAARCSSISCRSW